MPQIEIGNRITGVKSYQPSAYSGIEKVVSYSITKSRAGTLDTNPFNLLTNQKLHNWGANLVVPIRARVDFKATPAATADLTFSGTPTINFIYHSSPVKRWGAINMTDFVDQTSGESTRDCAPLSTVTPVEYAGFRLQFSNTVTATSGNTGAVLLQVHVWFIALID